MCASDAHCCHLEVGSATHHEDKPDTCPPWLPCQHGLGTYPCCTPVCVYGHLEFAPPLCVMSTIYFSLADEET